MKNLLAGIALMLLSALTFAQNSTCGFDHIHHQELEKNIEFRKSITSNSIILKKYFQTNKYHALLAEDELTIPVVFHVIHTGEQIGVGNNISDQQIQECLSQLNEGWNNNQGFIDMNIRFEMATIDPNCAPTNGINRVDGRVVANYEQYGISASYVAGDEIEVKNLSKWPNNSYYNIWVVNKIDNYDGVTPGTSGTAGYAYFPGVGPEKDGTVIINSQVGTSGTANSNNDGVTIIHEVGHGMGLYHTFEGDQGDGTCPPLNGCSDNQDNDPSNDGDCVSDTEAHITPSSLSSCPSGNTCNGRDMNGVQYNIMNYTNCQDRFTQGQKDRARAQLINNRSGLLVSKGLNTFTGTFSPANSASCSPQTSSNGLSGSYDEGINKVSLAGVIATSASSYSDGGYVDNSASCLSLMELDENSTNTITLNVAGVSSRYCKAWIDYNNDGSFDNSTEMIVDDNITTATDTDYSFTVPANATLDQTLRLRVSCDWSPISNGCDAPEYGQVEDYPVIINSASASNPPASEFTANNTAICIGSSIDFTDNSTNTPTSWSWSITGNETLSSAEQNPSITFNTAGIYTVTLTSTNSDGSDTETKTDYITVNALPTVAFSNGSSSTVATTDGNQSLSATPSGGTFSGTGVTGSSFDPSNAGVGTHTLTYSYTDSQTGCSASSTFVYTVTDGNSGGANPPASDFTANNTSICEGSTVDFTDNSTNTPTSWSWSITGNETLSSTDQNPSITFNTAGIYTVTLTSTNSDGSDTETKTDYITVNALPTVAFSNGSSSTVATTDGNQSLNATPSGGTFSGTGVTGSTFDPSNAGVGTHTLTYAYTDAQTGCSASSTFVYTVTNGNSGGTNPPVSEFQASSLSACAGSTIDFSDNSTNSPTNWNWTVSGNQNLSSTEQNPSFVFNTSGTYAVSLTVSNDDGSDTETKVDYITINDLPTVSFSAGTTATVSVSDGLQGLTGSPAGGSYSGTGLSGNDFDPSLAGEGNHVITYTYTDSQTGCSSSVDFEFIVTASVVNEAPIADFSISPSQVCVGNIINFYDASTNNPNTWVWSITGPTNYTSSEQNPSITFNIEGTYTISLNVSNAFGTDNLVKTDEIIINPNPEFLINSTSVNCYGGQDAMISVAVTNGTSGNQYSIGGTTQTSNLFSNLQAATYSVTVIDENSCFAMDEIAITQPNQIMGESAVYICPGETADIFGTVTSTPGTYTEVFTSANGCDSTHTISLFENSLPEITFGVSNIDSVRLDAGLLSIGSNLSPSGGTFTGEGIFGNQFNPAFAGVGTHEITYTYTDNFTGCSVSSIFTFVVLDLSTGMHEFISSINIYPNPSNGIINIEGNNIQQIEIFNSIGQSVFSSNDKLLNIDHLKSGIYFIEIRNTEGYSTKQRIVKH